MNKKQLCENIMTRVNKVLAEAGNDGLMSTNEKGSILVQIVTRTGKIGNGVISLFKSTGLPTDEALNGVTVFCKNYDEFLSVMEVVAKKQLFNIDENLQIKVFKKSKSGINDSVNEGLEVENVSGDFVTDFTWTNEELKAEGKFTTPDGLARRTVRYLVKKGLDVKLEQRRWSIRIHVHYDGKEQYDALVNWVAFFIGDAISPSAAERQLSAEDKQDAIDRISRGNNLTF